MKKKNVILPCACLALALASCNKESYRHSVMVAYPNPVSVVFGDQTSDSIVFDTFDSFEVNSYQTEWIKVLSTEDNPSKAKIKNSYYNMFRCTVYLQIEPNTTQKARNGYVTVRTYGDDDWDQTAHGYYKQYGWHNVQKPEAVYKYDQNEMIESCSFLSTDSALQVVDTLRFVAYDKWTLEMEEGSFVTSPKTSGDKGHNILVLDVEPNPTNDERSTSMKLKSASGVTTNITFKQKAPKKK